MLHSVLVVQSEDIGGCLFFMFHDLATGYLYHAMHLSTILGFLVVSHKNSLLHVSGWCLNLLMGHEAGLLILNNSLVQTSLVTTSMVLTSRRGAANESAPEVDDERANHHAEDTSSNTCHDTNSNREEDVSGDVFKEMSPALPVFVVRTALTVTVHVDFHVTTLLTSMAGATTTMLARSETTELLLGHRNPFAEHGRALLLRIHGRRLHVLGFSGGKIGDHQFTRRGLDQLDLDIGNAINECISNLDDLEVDHNELKIIVIISRGNQTRLQAKAEVLKMMRGRALDMSGELHLTNLEVRQEGGSEGVLEGIGLGIEFESIQEEAIDAIWAIGCSDTEVQLQVARDVGLDTGLFMVTLPVGTDSNRASRTIQLQVLSLGNLRKADVLVELDGYRKGGNDVVNGYVGRQ